jgi:chromate transporter
VTEVASSLPSVETPIAPPPPLLDIFIAFTRTALLSIGGGLTGWMMREFVESRRWLTESEFLTGLALAQAFPGVNVVNLAIWIGFRLRGGPGALVAALGTIIPSGVLAILLLSVFNELAGYRIVVVLLAGAAAAAIGMSLSMGVKASRAVAVHIAPALVIAAMFVALFVLRLPLLPVIVVMAPLSIAIAFWRLRRQGDRA